MRFTNRLEAGLHLANKLTQYSRMHPVVVALPRGGGPVAFEIARHLGAPLDVLSVRKVGAPTQPELGMGAVSEGGFVFIDPRIVSAVKASASQVQTLVREKQHEAATRAHALREGRPATVVAGRTVILVDDGIATGGTMHVALQALRAAGAFRVVVAVPVAATSSLTALKPLADDVVCLFATDELDAVGAWYDDFSQVPDAEVIRLLHEAHEIEHHGVEVFIPVENGAHLEGTLFVPERAKGVVVFAHGSGSSRFSPRNLHVAQLLHARGIGTLLFDLLTREEEEEDSMSGGLRFDIGLLASRLEAATVWLDHRAETTDLPIGYFGASTGAAAALVAAARHPGQIAAVVSRGGRPDLAGRALGRVRCPSLLLVGEEDREVLILNRRALSRLDAHGQHELITIPHATHLFEEPGALDAVATLAAQWFARWFDDSGAVLGSATVHHAPL